MRMNQSKNFIRVERKLRTVYSTFLWMSPSILRMSNVVVDTVLYIHVRDFAPARGINAEKCLHSKFQKIHLLRQKKIGHIMLTKQLFCIGQNSLVVQYTYFLSCSQKVSGSMFLCLCFFNTYIRYHFERFKLLLWEEMILYHNI